MEDGVSHGHRRRLVRNTSDLNGPAREEVPEVVRGDAVERPGDAAVGLRVGGVGEVEVLIP